MLIFVSVVHVLLCVFMIFVILLQPGKDAGMGAALGGGAATTAFGGRGAVTFLGKVTAVCAIAYFLTSLGLSFVGLRASVAGSVVPSITETVKPDAAKADAPKADAPKTDTAAGADTTAKQELQPPSTAPGTPLPTPEKIDGKEAFPPEKAPNTK